MFGSHHGWAQAKADTEDPSLKTPQGAYKQLKYRALGSAIMLGVIVVVIVLVTVFGDG